MTGSCERCVLTWTGLLLLLLTGHCHSQLSTWDRCAGRSDQCTGDHACDSSGHCMLKVGKACTLWGGGECPARGRCVKDRCVCTPGLGVPNADGICVPAAGRAGGPCLSGGGCLDKLATCNTTTSLCQCPPGFVVDRFRNSQCSLVPLQPCEGDSYGSLCMGGSACYNGTCKLKFGMSWAPYSPSCEGVCGIFYECSTTTKHCTLRLNDSCSRFQPDFCNLDNQVCDRVLGRCKRAPSSACNTTGDCVAGATCDNGLCQCIHDGTSYAARSEYQCPLPKGAVGAECGTAADASTGCSDTNASCDNNVCRCNHGYRTNLHTATCES